ncbi:sugar MFS transporter [Haloferula chungangensis]|uniref:Sugar MFS transporter n=1 Tax=Haloferula chungangensis TaxID=1048331 RepID=A0ABW2L870_9BACT
MSQNSAPSGTKFAFSAVTVLFFMWGFISCMNDLLIPKFKAEFDLSQFQANLVQFFFFGAYFLVSFIYFIISAAKGDPINKIGYKNGLILGLILTGGACLVFYPAANAESYPLFLTALCLLGSGVTIIQIAANPYISILGPESSASSRLNLSQGLNSLGYVLTPLIGGYFLFKEEVEAGLDSVKAPYLGLAVILFVIAAAIKFTKLPTFRQEGKVERGIKVFRHKHFKWGWFAIFFYVGAEVTVGSILVNYLGDKDIAGLTEEEGVKYLSFYWGGLMIGRLMGAISLSGLAQAKKLPAMVAAAVISIAIIFMSASFKTEMTFTDIWPYLVTVALSFVFFRLGNALPGRMVGLFALVAAVLSILAMTTSGEFALWSIVGIGLFNSIMWSNIFTLSIRGLGKDTSQGSSLLVMMIVGGAILPAIQGLLMDLTNVRLSLAIVLVSYLYLAFFGFVGSKIGREADEAPPAA